MRTGRDSGLESEARYRVWWSIYSLDRILSIMTGRPSATALGEFNAPLPSLSAEEDIPSGTYEHRTEVFHVLRCSGDTDRFSSGTTSAEAPSGSQPAPLMATVQGMEKFRDMPLTNPLFFRCQIHLDIMTHAILSNLYRVVRHDQLLAQAGSSISYFSERLQEWHAALPPGLDFARPTDDTRWLCRRLRLGFAYYSSRIILYRPCLSDPSNDPRSERLQRESHTIAAQCVESAQAMLFLIPQDMNRFELYGIVPWFAFIHYLMQSFTVLAIELAFRCHHCPSKASSILSDARKAVSILETLSETSPVAQRAFGQASHMLEQVAHKVGNNIQDASQGYFMGGLQHQQPTPQEIDWSSLPTGFEGNMMQQSFGNSVDQDNTGGSMRMDMSQPEVMDFSDPTAWPPGMPSEGEEQCD